MEATEEATTAAQEAQQSRSKRIERWWSNCRRSERWHSSIESGRLRSRSSNRAGGSRSSPALTSYRPAQATLPRSHMLPINPCAGASAAGGSATTAPSACGRDAVCAGNGASVRRDCTREPSRVRRQQSYRVAGRRSTLTSSRVAGASAPTLRLRVRAVQRRRCLTRRAPRRTALDRPTTPSAPATACQRSSGCAHQPLADRLGDPTQTVADPSRSTDGRVCRARH